MPGSEPIPEQGELRALDLHSGAGKAPSEVHRAEPNDTKEAEQPEERDEFGLPVKQKPRRSIQYDDSGSDSGDAVSAQENQSPGEGGFKPTSVNSPPNGTHPISDLAAAEKGLNASSVDSSKKEEHTSSKTAERHQDQAEDSERKDTQDASNKISDGQPMAQGGGESTAPTAAENVLSGHTGAVSGWSHQALAGQNAETERKDEEDDWKDMPAYAPFDMYNDDGKLVAREARDSDEDEVYKGLGGAGKGYTRIQLDEDAKSTTSMEENTDYLFKPKDSEAPDDDEEQRDPLAQLQATKDLLTEGQRIAYVGVTRLTVAKLLKQLEDLEGTRKTKKGKASATESLKMWGQQMMVRLYMHMEISSSEQLMIEQLAEHGVEPADLTPALMANARVKNPMAEEKKQNDTSLKSPALGSDRRSSMAEGEPSKSPRPPNDRKRSIQSSSSQGSDEDPAPPYQEYEEHDVPEVQSPEDLGTSKNIDIDIRWTILCDLFLLLLANSVYDARSRQLLEEVGEALSVSAVDICRFEKRVTESLEMQESAEKETWDEAAHLETRRKQALKRRYIVMGLATVGGGMIIGLSAGVLAPVIGAGLAAGFTTIGVAGTSGFLAGSGGIAIITTGAAVAGGTMGVRAGNRRTGAVKTFEYRPLHNNKRVNLIVTVSGWMSSKVDDVRLPFSTVDPVMGDIYSVLWEPDMLRSMGDTINILANEALSQTVQQVLGSTILVALMASLQLPIVLSKLTYLIDNPWTVSLGRANAAGLILADSLIDRNLGARPITMVGFSLGARVIFTALRELAARGAYGLIQNVYLFGSPMVANKDEYLRARSMVSGRFVNGYAANDWILGYLFRATSGGIMRVAGLAPVEGIAGIENVNVTDMVNGHMAYRAAMPKLLRRVGWEVESDEFTEIEDPDPENHEKRQRELIKEIDEARKEAEKKPEKKRFGLFKRGKLAEKKTWETYDDRARTEDDYGTAAAEGTNADILFDIEAIKRELASEQIDVKELESTAPPMKISIDDFKKPEEARPPPIDPYASLRETKSHDGTTSARPNGFGDEVSSSQPSLPNGQQKDNPFNQGYDEYNLSAETVDGKLSSEYGKLSFDTHPPSQSLTQSPDPSQDLTNVVSHSDPQNIKDRSPSPAPAMERPPLRSSSTLPTGSVGMPPQPAVEHNAWADEEDENFGKEQEVTMTFG